MVLSVAAKQVRPAPQSAAAAHGAPSLGLAVVVPPVPGLPSPPLTPPDPPPSFLAPVPPVPPPSFEAAEAIPRTAPPAPRDTPAPRPLISRQGAVGGSLAFRE